MTICGVSIRPFHDHLGLRLPCVGQSVPSHKFWSLSESELCEGGLALLDFLPLGEWNWLSNLFPFWRALEPLGGFKLFPESSKSSNSVRSGLSTTGSRESQLGPVLGALALSHARELPSHVKGAGLRFLSRRGSWVRIPPPAPRKNVKLLGTVRALKGHTILE